MKAHDLLSCINDGALGGGITIGDFLRSQSSHIDALGNCGVAPGVLVVLPEVQGLDLFKRMLSVWKLGAVPVICDDLPDAPEDIRCVVWRTNPVVTRNAAPSLALADAAIVQTTSGTTSSQKYVCRSAKSLMSECAAYKAILAPLGASRAGIICSIRHSYGMGFFLGCLATGLEATSPTVFLPRRIARSIDEQEVDVLALTPQMAQLLAEVPGEAGAQLLLAMAGAGVLREETDTAFYKRFGVMLARNYGSTETGATFAGRAGLPSRVIGTPMAGVEILSPGPEEIGELQIKLPAPALGTLGNLRSETFWRTGDLVERNEHDLVTFVERLSADLRVNGKFFEVSAIRAEAMQHPAVTDIFFGVRPRPDDPGIEELLIVLEVKKAVPVTAEWVPSFDVSVPHSLVRLERFPRNTLGKIDRDRILQS